MRPFNIFDELTNNEDIPEEALCAIYDFFETLMREFEMSAFYRIKVSLQKYKQEAKKFEVPDLDCDEHPF